MVVLQVLVERLSGVKAHERDDVRGLAIGASDKPDSIGNTEFEREHRFSHASRPGVPAIEDIRATDKAVGAHIGFERS